MGEPGTIPGGGSLIARHLHHGFAPLLATGAGNGQYFSSSRLSLRGRVGEAAAEAAFATIKGGRKGGRPGRLMDDQLAVQLNSGSDLEEVRGNMRQGSGRGLVRRQAPAPPPPPGGACPSSKGRSVLGRLRKRARRQPVPAAGPIGPGHYSSCPTGKLTLRTSCHRSSRQATKTRETTSPIHGPKTSSAELPEDVAEALGPYCAGQVYAMGGKGDDGLVRWTCRPSNLRAVGGRQVVARPKVWRAAPPRRFQGRS